MAVQNPPVFIQGDDHPAEDIRRYMDAMVESRKGIVSSGDFAVTENGTPNMTVTVAAGRAFILGTENASQGMYFVEARTSTSVVITAAHATLARKDLIVAKVEDAAYSGAVNAWSLVAVAGTPAGSPAEPAVPANALVLAMVDIPAADTTIGNAQITDRRTSTSGQGRAAALGGVIVCTSTTRPAHSAGRVIYETDTGLIKTSNGAAWAGVTSSGTFSTVRKTADESVTSSTVMQNDDHLLIPVLASTKYLVEAWIACVGTTGTSGPNLKFGWTGPAGATMRFGYHAEDLLSASGPTWVTSIGSTLSLNGAGWAGDSLLIHVMGYLDISTTPGNLQLQWAQATSSATATQVLQGSAIRITPVT